VSARPAGGKHHTKLPPQQKNGLSTDMLLILTLGGSAFTATLMNPPVGIAIGVGLGVVGLLHKIVG